LLEFAIVVPILLVLMAAIADFGIMYVTAQTVQHATREGARFAAKLEGLEDDDFRVNDYIQTYIPDESLYSSFTDISTQFSGCPNDEVTVTISGNYNFLALNMIGLNSLPLSMSTQMRYELCE
jgi:Flp pilus assembly protein TadG